MKPFELGKSGSRERSSSEATTDFFRSIIDTSGDDIYVVKPDGDLVYVNKTAVKSLGYTVGEITAMNVSSFDPVMGPRFPSFFEELKKGEALLLETVHITKDGKRRFKEIRTVPVDIDGNKYICGIARDITERKATEESLRKRAEELDRHFNNSLDLLCVASTNGYFIQLNREWEKTLGYSLEELKNRRFFDFIHPDDIQSTSNIVASLDAHMEILNFTNRYRCKDGSYRWIEWRSYPDDGVIYAVARDVTEHKKMEEELRTQREELKSIFRSAPTGIGLVIDRIIRDVNERLCEMTGYGREELIDYNSRILYPDDEEYETVGRKKYRQITEKGTGTVETRWKRKDGRIIDVLLSSTPLSPHDSSSRVTFTALDITDRKLYEKTLMEGEERYRAVFENTGAATVILEKDTVISLANSQFEMLSGYSKTEIEGKKSWTEFVVKEDLVRMVEQHNHRRERRETALNRYEFRFVRRTGEVRHIFLVIDIIAGTDKSVASLMDVTEQKRAEEERLDLERRLLHAQKMESLGILAGGIAHDFNNLLMAILGNLDLALSRLSPLSSVRLNIEQAIHASHRAADLTRQMLAYSGKGKFSVDNISINKLIKDNAHLLRASIPSTTTLDLHLREGVPAIEADPGQIQQVILNLLTNASEAIGEEEAGIINFETGMLHCDSDYLSLSRLDDKAEPGLYVFLEVTDTGCGMDEETQNRLFEPFFSTKFTGRGLGMSAVHGIVKGHKGAILTENAPGRGTTVRVLFPAAVTNRDDKVQDKVLSGKVGEIDPTLRVGGTVLLVEDVEMVREVCKTMVEGLGFSVITAENGRQAVEFFRDNFLTVDCVLLDLYMPVMDGYKAFQEMLLIYPEAKIILSSGYNEEDALKKFAGERVSGFIQKPYKINALKEVLEKAVGEKAGS